MCYLASASDAIIIGFNVRPMGNARQIADKEEIDIRMYHIYAAINDLKGCNGRDVVSRDERRNHRNCRN